MPRPWVHCLLLSSFVWRAKANLPGSGSLCAHLSQETHDDSIAGVLLDRDESAER